MFNFNDYLDEHDEEITEGGRTIPVTVVSCECGKSWVVHNNDDGFKYGVREFSNILDDHFTRVHGADFNE